MPALRRSDPAGRFAQQIRFFEQRPSAVCVGGRVELITEAGDPLMSPEPIVGNHQIQ